MQRGRFKKARPLVALLFLAFASCASAQAPQKTAKDAESGFCGSSTRGPCQSDADCLAGGCGGQVCQSKTEPAQITTCEYRDCYNAAKYSQACGCVEHRCQWHELK